MNNMNGKYGDNTFIIHFLDTLKVHRFSILENSAKYFCTCQRCEIHIVAGFSTKQTPSIELTPPAAKRQNFHKLFYQHFTHMETLRWNPNHLNSLTFIQVKTLNTICFCTKPVT